jgi:hypothetical protein
MLLVNIISGRPISIIAVNSYQQYAILKSETQARNSTSMSLSLWYMHEMILFSITVLF